jgi:hypothetical protein
VLLVVPKLCPSNNLFTSLFAFQVTSFFSVTGQSSLLEEYKSEATAVVFLSALSSDPSGASF